MKGAIVMKKFKKTELNIIIIFCDIVFLPHSHLCINLINFDIFLISIKIIIYSKNYLTHSLTHSVIGYSFVIRS